MDVKDVIIGLYNSYIDTNKSFMELGKICRKAFSRQDRINGRLFACVLAGATYAVYSEKKRKEQEKKIEKLSKELEMMKGE